MAAPNPNDVANAFTNHYYQAFDSNPDGLGGLFVSFVSALPLLQGFALARMIVSLHGLSYSNVNCTLLVLQLRSNHDNCISLITIHK